MKKIRKKRAVQLNHKDRLIKQLELREVIMFTFQDEEILKGEKKIRHWQLKFVGLQSRIDNNLSNIAEQFEDLLLSLDEMRILKY